MEKEIYRQLAKNLAIAYTMNQLGVSWATAEKYFAKQELGDVWFQLAELSSKMVTGRIKQIHLIENE